jgi:hypothetical protein
MAYLRPSINEQVTSSNRRRSPNRIVMLLTESNVMSGVQRKLNYTVRRPNASSVPDAEPRRLGRAAP